MHNQPSSCSGNERAIHPSHSTHTPASASAVDAHRAQVDARLRSSANSRTLVVVLQGTHRAPPCARAQAKQGRGPATKQATTTSASDSVARRRSGLATTRAPQPPNPTRGARIIARVIVRTRACRSWPLDVNPGSGRRRPRRRRSCSHQSPERICLVRFPWTRAALRCSLPVGSAATRLDGDFLFLFFFTTRVPSLVAPRTTTADGTPFHFDRKFFVLFCFEKLFLF
jgi:hypothetical protein